MARMKRVVITGYPHHVVQRGVRSLGIFLKEQDRIEYLNLLGEQGDRFGTLRTARPFGSDDFYNVVEKITGCDTRPGNPGRSAKQQ